MAVFLRRKSSSKKKPVATAPCPPKDTPPPSLPPLFSQPPPPPQSQIEPVSPPAPPLDNPFDVDPDWAAALIRFIDQPPLQADEPETPSGKQTFSPPVAASDGAALVTSNRYLSGAQKTRIAAEQGIDLCTLREDDETPSDATPALAVSSANHLSTPVDPMPSHPKPPRKGKASQAASPSPAPPSVPKTKAGPVASNAIAPHSSRHPRDVGVDVARWVHTTGKKNPVVDEPRPRQPPLANPPDIYKQPNNGPRPSVAFVDRPIPPRQTSAIPSKSNVRIDTNTSNSKHSRVHVAKQPPRPSTAPTTSSNPKSKPTPQTVTAVPKPSAPPTSYPEQRMANGQTRGRNGSLSQNTAHASHTRGHSHKRSLSPDSASGQSVRSPPNAQANHHSESKNPAISPQSRVSSPAYGGAIRRSGYPSPNTVYPTIPPVYPTYCPPVYPAVYNPFQTYQAPAYNPFYTFGSAYPSPPGEYTSLDRTSKTGPGLYNSTSATSFVDAKGARQSTTSAMPAAHAPVRKSSGRSASDHGHADKPGKPRVLAKPRPTSPSAPRHVATRPGSSSGPGDGANGHRRQDESSRLLLDSDPFAKTEGVCVISRSGSLLSSHCHSPSLSGHGHDAPARQSRATPRTLSADADVSPQTPSSQAESLDASAPQTPPTPVSPANYQAARQQRRGVLLAKEVPPLVAETFTQRSIMRSSVVFSVCESEGIVQIGVDEVDVDGDGKLESEVEVQEEEEPEPPKYFPLSAFLGHANFLAQLLEHMEFADWLSLYAVNRREVRALFDSSSLGTKHEGLASKVERSGARRLREVVLERFLRRVGYVRWDYEWAEPIALSLRDLNNYMLSVSMPTHNYARLARAYLEKPTGTQGPDVLSLALTTRAYTKVVLRLRAQAESEAKWVARVREAHAHSCDCMNPSYGRVQRGRGKIQNRPHISSDGSSRASSPTPSSRRAGNSHTSRSAVACIHASQPVSTRRGSTSAGSRVSYGSSNHSCACHQLPVVTFESPLFRPGRAALLRVFVPSPDGTWLSDASVVECEAELRRSGTGVTKLLRVGDVVWDAALGDEGNVGRMVWDGNYLVDLDYKYSRLGELSPYFHSLAFSPSYFHRVIRIAAPARYDPHANPIVYVDVSPWGEEIAKNLQLLQERGRTETPHGALHDVVRWMHRSSFQICPPSTSSSASQAHTVTTTPSSYTHLHAFPYLIPRYHRLPLPGVSGGFVDPGWYGMVVLEAEGTNEGLLDLQERCGPGVFPPRVEGVIKKARGGKDKDCQRVWRVMREKSRPGEIWLRAVREKERMM